MQPCWFAVIAIWVILQITTSTIITEDKIAFIGDFVKSTSRPSIYTAFVCWSIDNTRNLMKQWLTEENYRSIQFAKIHNETIKPPLPPQQAVFIADLGCDGITDVLNQAESLKLFSGPFRWLMLADDTANVEDLNEHLASIGIYTDSDVVVAYSDTNSSIRLVQPYKLSAAGGIIYEEYGMWSAETGIVDLRSSPVLANRRTDLQGTLITTSVVILHNSSLDHLDDFRQQHIDSISKANYILTHYLIDTVNGTRKFNFVPTWGYPGPDNISYTGMFGELQRGEADIGGTASFITRNRFDVARFIAMMTPTKIRFVFRQPPLSLVENVFTLPFTRSVWICEAALVVLIAATLYITVFWEKRGPSQKIQNTDGILAARVGDITMLTIGAVCQQGSTTEPRSGPGRSVMIILFIILMFLYTSFSANIVALLQSSSSSIRTLSDLLNSRLDLGAEDTVYNRYYFSTATETVRRKIFELKIAPPGQVPHFTSMIEGVKRVQKGLYAFHMEVGPGYKLVSDVFYESEKCGLQEIEYFQVADPWTPVPRNSTYLEIFKIVFSKMAERGVQSRVVRRLYTSKPKCLGTGSSFVSVGLTDIYFAFYIIIVGTAIALVFFLFEILGNRCLRHKMPVTPIYNGYLY